MPAQRASERIVRDCALRGIVFHPTSQTGKRLPDAGCFRLSVWHSASIKNNGVRARFEQQRYRSAGRFVFGSRNKPPLSFDVSKAWHRPAKLISELDSSVVECEACASIVSAPKQSFADRSPIYDDLQRVVNQQHMLRHLSNELVNVRARITFQIAAPNSTNSSCNSSFFGLGNSGALVAIKIHDLGPCGHKVFHKFLLRISAGVYLRERTKLRV